MHFTVESFPPVVADEVTERVDSGGDSGSAGDSEEDEPDPRVQEEVGSKNDGISNSTEICDLLKLV